MATPAFADATLTTADEAQASSFITVSMSNLPSNYGSVVNVEQCRKTDADPTFNPISDCDQSTADNETVVAGSSVKSFRVFNGPNENLGTWGCGPLAPGTPQCYIRLSGDTGVANDQFYPLVYGPVQSTTTTEAPTTTLVPPSEVPEASLSVLLPLTAVGLAGGGLFIARRRRPKTAA
jgi:hypothetical protein